jgi:D-psicose/D-tagatose/L-ribulose 3-epimerase
MRFGMGMLLWADDVCGAEWLPLFGRLREAGFDFVEVPVFRTEEARFRDLGARLRGLGLEATAMTALAAGQDLLAAEPARRAAGLEHLRRAAGCARALGAPLLGGPLYQALGVFSGAPPTADERSRAREGLRAAAGYAADAGVTLAIEPLNRFEVHLLNSAADAAAFVREVGHPALRMTYDTFHAHVEEKDPEAAIRACADVLAHVQASECDRSTPGAGQVAWKPTFAALAEAGYAGRIAIEAFGQRLPALAAATRIWRRMFADEERLAAEGLDFLRRAWREAG